MNEEEEYYVSIREPENLRKNILETSRQVVLSLQRYEHFKINSKKEECEALKRTLREINELISRLKKELPVKKVKSIPPISDKKISAITKTKKPEIASLEKDLAEIEKKLSLLK